MDANVTTQPASVTSPDTKAISIAILAMGGEGGGVLADWLVDLAEHAGYFAQSTSVPGVAQRTGATIYYVELFPETESQRRGRQPVLGLMPVPGEVDVVIASELMEAGRAIQRGLVTPDRTVLIASEHRVYSISERSAMADGRVDSQKLLEASQAAARQFVHGDFARLADEHGSVISASLFGALAARGGLPFTREQFVDAIRRGGVGVESSLAAFEAGYAAASQPAPIKPPPVSSPAASNRTGRLANLITRVTSGFHAASHDVILAGVHRLVDFQDERYAREYLDWLAPIRDADAQHGPGAFLLLTETARYLALWMAYEDAVRVADLKIRRARFERVRREVKARPGQIVRINEFLHPGIEEITDILPAGLSRFLLRTKPLKRLLEKFTSKGRIVETTSLAGFLMLYTLASMRPLRRRSLRFERERRFIQQWLAQLPSLAAEDYALAVEAAECPRLIKGYGETHARGMQSYLAVMSAIPRLRGKPGAAEALRRLREAALKDESGRILEQTLQEVNA